MKSQIKPMEHEQFYKTNEKFIFLTFVKNMAYLNQRRKSPIFGSSFLGVFLVQCLFTRCSFGAEVFSINPPYGSLCGETRMLISGTGFSQNKLSEGNEVQLVSLETSYDCPVSKDGTMESMIMCYTVPGMKEGVYYVRVIVDGVPIPDENMCQPEGPYSDKCLFEVRTQNTPYIQSVSPTSISPGPESIIALGGMIFTDRYGTNVAASSNGKEETVNRVYAGPLTCELRKTNDELYGLQLDSPSSNKGQMKCRYQGTYIGNSNASFIIGDGPYGRSCRQLDTLLVSINKQIYQFQTFPEITGVTPSSGSTDGGTDLTIAGNYFTGTMENTEVYIGGEECEITSLTSTEIQCTSPPQPAELPTHFCGNRGLLLEVWTSGTKLYTELADIETLTSSDIGYSEQLIGQSSFSHPETNYVSRTRGSFIAPYSGEYLFMIKSADASSLRLSTDGDPANKVEIAKCESTCPEYGSSPSQTSGRVVLTESQKYYMEVLHSYGSSSSPLVQVAARYFDTELTNQSTGIVNMEHQLVKVTSTVVREVQRVKIEVVADVGSQRNEYQVIEVTELSGGTSDATYRLGLYGVYTEPFTSTSTSTDFRRAFENLPWYMNSGDTVGVQITHSTSSEVKVTIEIQFFTGRGDIPTLEFLQADGSQGEKLDIQIRETVKGIPSPYTFAMQMEGIISPLINNINAVIPKIDEMFTTRCPKFLGQTGFFHQSFETNGGNSGGEWMNDREAFCGRGLVKNPTYLYLDNGGFYLQGTVNTICFGYHGAIQDTLTFKYTYMDETMTLIENNYKSFTISIGEESDEWKYTCFDILSALSSFKSNGQSFKIQYIKLSRAGDVFVDEVYIGQGPSTLDQENVNLLRMKPVMPNGHRIHYTQGIDTTVPPVYSVDITFFPLECGHDFPLLSVVPEQTNNMKVEVERLSAASPPVTGTFTLTFEGQESVAISPSVTGEELKEILMTSVPNMGEVYTYRHGDCANFDLSIAFLSRPGDLETIQFSSQLSGNEVSMTVESVADGSLNLDPIQGDMLCSYSSSPQVTVFVNDIPARCSASSPSTGCSFNWDPSSTPIINSCSTSGSDVVITGSGFSASVEDVTVKIKNADCTVIAASETEITCTPSPQTPAGNRKINVYIAGKGKAALADGASCRFFSTLKPIVSVTPSSCSVGGRCLMTITGGVFSADVSITMNNNVCEIKEFNNDVIKCIAPKSTVVGSAELKVMVEDQSETSTVNYVTSPFVDEASITLTEEIIDEALVHRLVFGGSNWVDANTVKLFIDGNEVTPITVTGTFNLEATFDLLPSGTYSLELQTEEGNAVDSGGNIPSITVQERQITNVYPATGSLRGGTKLIVSGQGFNTLAPVNKVKVGSHDCLVKSSTPSELTCQIADTGRTHLVTNDGIHPSFRISGYAWEPKNLQVNVGDTVEWRWKFAQFITGMKVRVVQVKGLLSQEEEEGGFNSGPATSEGGYQFQFLVPGTYHYWSDFVDFYTTTHFSGVVEVLGVESYSAEVNVMLNDIEFTHVKPDTADPSPAGTCPGTIGDLGFCTTPTPPAGDPNKHTFGFWNCATPTVTQISLREGTTFDIIEIKGQGVDVNTCELEVKFGEDMCTVQGIGGSGFFCTVDSGNNPTVGVLQEISVLIKNRGYALIDIEKRLDRSFALLPAISTVSPLSGSTAGGTFVTISGTGFPEEEDKVIVSIGGYICHVESSSSTEIKCISSAQTVGSKDVKVTVITATGSEIMAVCKHSSGSCTFLYSSTATPEVTTVTPDAITGTTETTLTLTGSNLKSMVEGATVVVGGQQCAVQSQSVDIITCTITNLPLGMNDVSVDVAGFGSALSSLTVTSPAAISSVTPVFGSVYGGTTITFLGNGFTSDATVSIGGVACEVKSASLSEMKCITGPKVAGSYPVNVQVGSVSYPQQNYEYRQGISPEVTSITPSTGGHGETVTIVGQNFVSPSKVTIGEAECTVVSETTVQIVCTTTPHAVGSQNVVVESQHGISNDNVQYEYVLSVTSFNPTSGSIFGGQDMNIDGAGFDENVEVRICDEICPVDYNSLTASSLICKVPPSSDGTAKACDVEVSSGTVLETAAGAYNYDPSMTPSMASLNPTRGGTGGGSSLTISGTGFGTDEGSVLIDGSTCSVDSWTEDTITCTTDTHEETGTYKVMVLVPNKGMADSGSLEFTYIDVWSSPWTWGGGSIPVEGELVVIREGHTVLLDVDTPILNTLLIDGGSLIFDEKDLELQAHKILITKGGKLQVGTESEPFSWRAFITLHGHVHSKELPVYGTKMIGVRNGSLELHGKKIVTSWTRLENTANAGATEIVLTHPVDWVAGDVVVIATTNHRHRQQETEQHTIASVSADKRTLTLEQPLTYSHLGVTGNYGGQDIEFRAEVGLLSRTITFRGTVDEQWNDPIEQCPDGFDTGEFAVRSCFNGLFGEEIGVDQFGAHILLHAPQPDSGSVHAYIEYVEFHYVGQAFRLGRYPVHFHLNGDMMGSYVRGCSFHQSFNRAVNIHGTHNVVVEYNVAYNIMGGAMFLEDGVETGNTFQYNLMLFVIASSSLQNDDNSPAAFWVTNPNNIVQHNAVAGGTHFGFWYRMHEHPSGPSFTTSICPQKVPIGIFLNNTVHSNGWFGLWVFQKYTPRAGGSCGSGTPEEALFSDLTAWNCEKGAEIVDGGSVRLRNFVLVNNKLSGYEGKMVLEGSQVIENALIVGHASELTLEEQGCTRDGIKLPYGYGFHVKNVKFVNFDKDGCAAFGVTRITGTCSVNCGGYSYTTEGLTFVNSPNRGQFFWAWEALITDLDGSLTTDGPSPAAAGKTVLPSTGTLPSTCTAIDSLSKGSAPAVACPSELKYHRFTFNGVPKSLEGKDAVFTNAHGSSTQPYRSKAVTHKKGWLIVFLDGMEYTLDFTDNPGHTNFTYNGRIDNFKTKDEYVIVKQIIQQEPSRLFIDWSSGHIPKPETAIDVATSNHGHWEYSQPQMELKYLVRGYNPSSVGSTTNRNIGMKFNVYKCFFEDCKPPPDPNTVPPEEERPDDAVFWSVKETWSDAEEGWGGYKGEGLYDLPVDGDSVKIPKDKWVVADTTLPQMEKLILYGVLELDDDGGSRDFELRCKYIIIRGGRLIIGWPDKPFLANALVILEGDRQTEYFEQDSGPTIGAKVLAAFGGVDMHGIQKGDTWTRLAQTASPGDTQITLESTVEWMVGDEIIVAPTGYKPEEVERFTIAAVSVDTMTITLDSPLQYKHIAHTHTAGSKTLTMAAEVGRLTRNIRFEGAAYPDMLTEAFGARIMVSRIVENGLLYIGYARLSNVEFRFTGQEGWVERGDARTSLAFADAGTVNPIKPSYVKHCSFHKSFAPAITVHGTNNLPIEWNIMADSVWFALETTSSSTLISHNFVTNVRWDGCFNGRFESMNVRYNGAFNLNKATNLVLEYNAVGGAQRVGYNILGEECGVTTVWKDNVAHTTLLGVANFQQMTVIPEGMDCIQIKNFHVWKNLDYGIYYNNLVSSVIEGIKAADNGVNIFQFIIGPAAVQHQYENKFAEVFDSLIVGTSDAFDCSIDVPNTNDCNIKLSKQSRSHSPRRLGITMATFSSGGNKAPEKPFAGIKAYQAIGGRGYLSDVTFSKFSDRCSTGRDMVIAPNFQSDDGNHRMEVSTLTFVDVDEESKIFYPRSNLGLINPSDCVDMSCDAKIKALLVDTDGSFLGQAGSVIPQSEYQWNGDPAYMLGDYRVPKEMQVTPDGERISMDTLAPHKGIIRDDTCTYVTEWQAYKCPSFKHYTLTIESMDKDTETRRISPVAILGDGYLDLINGPQDHGWCSGYTCRKRLSTFQSIVALNKDYLLHYTGTSPQQSRFMMLDVNENACIQLSIWYAQPWRLDVYHEDQYILPANARHVGDVGTIVYDPPPVGEPDKFKPSAATCADVSGSNFFDRVAGVLTILIKGPKLVRIVTMDSVIVSLQFPAMSLEEFFGENIIMNIAAFLDIDPKFVRVTDITRESTGDKRKRRAVDENIVGATIEISNPPGTPTDADSLTKDDLEQVSVDLINGIQLTNFSEDINMNSNTSYSISRNIPETDSPEWQQMTSSESGGYLVVQVADHMIFHTDLEPLHEGAPFKIQPKIQVVDQTGEIIKVLGAEQNTWKLTATIRDGTGNPDAVLLGTETVQFVNGMATFTDLAISHFGTDYILDFTVTEPDVGEPFVVASEKFTLEGRPIVAVVESKSPVIVERSAATIRLELRDAVTNQIIDDIDWRGHSWEVTAKIGMPELYDENIMDSQTVTFDVNSGQATFDNLLFYTAGVFVVQFNITSTPADYSIELQEIVVVRGISQEDMTTEVSKEIGLKFEANYDSIVGTANNKYFAAMVLNWVAGTYTDVIPAPKLVYKGSIMVTFNMGGDEGNITSTISSLCMAIQNGTHFTFIGQDLTLSGYMTVDGNKYYGVSCGVISSDDGTDSAMPIIIIVAVVGGLLIFAVIILITCMIYKTKVSPRAKTHDLEQVLQNEKSFNSVRSYKQHPPNSTTLTGEKRMAADYWKM